jgi:hypothetical protein
MSAMLSEPWEEAGRVIDAATAAGVELRVTGGVAIRMICPSAREGPLARSYNDIDFIALGPARRHVEPLFASIGYEPEEEFNALHGATRMFFRDPVHGREADVFIGGVRGCHRLDVQHRLTLWATTLSPADLLLSKLQVLQTTEKDFKDALALLCDHELSDDDSGICVKRITDVCREDWGWWRTVTMVAERTGTVAREWRHDGPRLGEVPPKILSLLEAIEQAPKSRRWKMRARVGERVRWHDEPEELAHEGAA